MKKEKNLEDKTEQALNIPVITNCGDRDYLATEIMKIHVANQIKMRRMSVWSRIKWWLNIDGWKIDYDLNAKDITQKSYEFADMVIKERG